MAKRKANRPKFPYGEKNDKILEEGERIAKARYHDGLRSTAKEIVDEKAEDPSMDVHDRIAEEADRAVIYTREALNIIVQSDNWTAAEDEGLEWPSDDLTKTVTIWAYYAYQQDLMEYVEAYASEADVDI